MHKDDIAIGLLIMHWELLQRSVLPRDRELLDKLWDNFKNEGEAHVHIVMLTHEVSCGLLLSELLDEYCAGC